MLKCRKTNDWKITYEVTSLFELYLKENMKKLHVDGILESLILINWRMWDFPRDNWNSVHRPKRNGWLAYWKLCMLMCISPLCVAICDGSFCFICFLQEFEWIYLYIYLIRKKYETFESCSKTFKMKWKIIVTRK